ncbi:MAG: peptidoglycan-binding protein [Gammaproteobacteria bacterium]
MNERALIFAAAVAGLSGCGTNPIDRGLSGAGLGAGAGAAIGAIAGAPVAGAAAIGAAAGGLTGVVTGHQQLNLGDPPWRRAVSGSGSGTSSPQTVAWIQQRLNSLGYDAGPVDGRAGTRTRNAIRAYQRDRGLLADGEPTYRLADSMWRSGS